MNERIYMNSTENLTFEIALFVLIFEVIIICIALGLSLPENNLKEIEAKKQHCQMYGGKYYLTENGEYICRGAKDQEI